MSQPSLFAYDCDQIHILVRKETIIFIFDTERERQIFVLRAILSKQVEPSE